MKKIGITGGIGSGKSTVSELFEVLGVPVFNSDSEAKTITNTDELVISAIKTQFGEALYVENKLDRKKMADIVFADRKKLTALNNIIHPAVAKRFKSWCAKQKTSYVLKEAAILFESGANEELNQVIYVSAPQPLRVKRVQERDGVLKEQVIARMKNQWDDKKKEKLSDFVILNDESTSLIKQVNKIHKVLSA